MEQHFLYLSLGSNLGDRHAILRQAIRLLAERVGTVEKVSSFVETEPWGFLSDNKFINVCCRLLTRLTPRQCLEETQTIERMLGREEKKNTTERYADRLIDIDILLYDDMHIDEPGLTIPHPHMLERDFVMTPLKELLSSP